MGLEILVGLVVALVVVIVWGLAGVAVRFLRPSDEPLVCTRCHRKELLSRWSTVHERFHEDADPKTCTPCLNPKCKHSCEEHQQLAGSYERRFMCHVSRCPCQKFERLIVTGTFKGVVTGSSHPIVLSGSGPLIVNCSPAAFLGLHDVLSDEHSDSDRQEADMKRPKNPFASGIAWTLGAYALARALGQPPLAAGAVGAMTLVVHDRIVDRMWPFRNWPVKG